MTNSWAFESNRNRQIFLAILIIFVGILLTYLCRNYDASRFSDTLAGFLLGLMLILIGVPAFVVTGKERTVIDTHARCILIEYRSRFKRKNTLIHFDDILSMRVAHIGRYSSGVVTYYISMDLRSGEKQLLFFPAYYEGRWSFDVLENRLRKLEEIMGLQSRSDDNSLL